MIVGIQTSAYNPSGGPHARGSSGDYDPRGFEPKRDSGGYKTGAENVKSAAKGSLKYRDLNESPYNEASHLIISASQSRYSGTTTLDLDRSETLELSTIDGSSAGDLASPSKRPEGPPKKGKSKSGPFETHDCKIRGCERIMINVSGQRFETQLRTLKRFPNTLLGNATKREKFFDKRRQEYFFDRHRTTFPAILYYYQSGGRLKKPIEVPDDIFIEELQFYGISEAAIRTYKMGAGFILEKTEALPTVRWQRGIWKFVEVPESSLPAKIFAILSVLCILVSISNFCLETLPMFERAICLNVTSDGGLTYYIRPNYSDTFFIVETVCIVWFTVEFILRLISCPSKKEFCKGIMNIFDVLAIVPYFIVLLVQQTEGNCESAKKSGSFVVIRVLRIFRIFKLSKHSQGLRILGMTIKTSMRELGMFFFFLVVAMVMFSACAYYSELGLPDTQFHSIPGTFWWAIVTMTTVGYGDVVPVGLLGKCVGTLCVIAGVLTIALPVPVVVANFNNFYRQESGRGYISA